MFVSLMKLLKECIPRTKPKGRKEKVNLTVLYVQLDMMKTNRKCGILVKWTQIMLQLGAKEEKQISRIVRCFVKHITEQKGTSSVNNFTYLSL